MKLAKLRPRGFKPVVPGVISPMKCVPSHIVGPEYSESGVPGKALTIRTYSPSEIPNVRKSARLARKMLDFACSLVKPGVSTDYIDSLVYEEILKHGAYPSPINYCGFPKTICTSVNEVVCHGIPDSRVLEDGDIVSIDVSVFLNGYHGDNCGTAIAGKAQDKNAELLVKTTQLALDKAIATCRPGSCLSSIGETIENVAKENGFSVVKDFCGHGTGSLMHMPPLVFHFKNSTRLPLREGMVFTIEPILAEGNGEIDVWDDNWTAYTLDGGRGAQFEHEVLITSNGVEVLTISE